MKEVFGVGGERRKHFWRPWWTDDDHLGTTRDFRVFVSKVYFRGVVIVVFSEKRFSERSAIMASSRPRE